MIPHVMIYFFAVPFLLFCNFLNNNLSERIKTDRNQEPILSFGIIADVQYSDSEPAGTRFYRSSLNKLREAVTNFRNDSVSFVITLGDLIEKDIRSYEPVLNILDSSGLTCYHVAGNHDYSVAAGDKSTLPSKYIKSPGYYSFSYNFFRFIFLNGNEISTYSSDNDASIKQVTTLLDSLRIKGEPNAMEWNGGISDKQLKWLDKQMKEASSKNEKVLIFCHFPVIPENVHNLLNYKDVLFILSRFQNCVAWFNGHNHAGNYGNYNKTHFITLKGMVETESQNSFARVDVYRHKILIIGSGREKSQTLAY